VTDVCGAPAAGIRTAKRGRRWVATLSSAAICSLVSAVSLSATLFFSSAPVEADQVSSLQAQAAQISSSMLLEQLQIGGYQQRYSAAIAKVGQDDAVLSQTRATIEAVQQKIGHDAATLRGAAVTAYEEGGSGAAATPLFVSQQSEGSRTEYVQVLSSTLWVAEDKLHSDRQVLHQQEASLEQVQAQDLATQQDAQNILQQSENTESQLQQQQQQVNGQLAVAVAQQQAQEEQAAAAAVAAAKARTAGSANTGQVTASSGRSFESAPLPTTAPSLNSFLQCVIQAESGGDYQAVSPGGTYMGAFQFSQSTWNEAADLAGMPQLVNVPPYQATPAEQDDLAIALYNADGSHPWYDPCTGY
jgi:resuscitation-promoting factor RpfB